MHIKNHLLYLAEGRPAAYVPTPNKGGKYTPAYLVMHYTAVTSPGGTIAWIQNPAAKASAHLLIDREGHITQFAPFNTIAWHAGVNRWNGIDGLNAHAIGIKRTNGGRLSKVGENFLCPVGQRLVAPREVVYARHKNEEHTAYWEQYTERQMAVAMLLASQYGLKDVLGHDDIAPHRKSDPGPACPMSGFRAKALGGKDEQLNTYRATTELNIRAGAGSIFPKVIPQALPSGTNVLILKREGIWAFIEVLDVVHGENDLEGWVSSKYLIKV